MDKPQVDDSKVNKAGPDNEDDLILSERNFKLFWDTMGRGVVYHDERGMPILMNPAAEKILGQSLQELQNWTNPQIKDKTIREDGSNVKLSEHPVMVALKTGREVHGEALGVFNHREKAFRWINVSATPLFKPGETKPYRVYTIIEDITERKQSREASFPPTDK